MTIVDQALALGLPVFTGQTLQRPTEEMSALSNQIAEKETPPFGSKKNGGVSCCLNDSFISSPRFRQ